MVQRMTLADADALTDLTLELWPEHERAEMAGELAETLTDPDAAFFGWKEDGEWVAFAQCGLRKDYVEGCGTSPVGYLEGIYVRDACRGRGIARSMLESCQAWAREKGCAEFASDCELDNTGSLAFHLAAGFREAGRIICFVKKLS